MRAKTWAVLSDALDEGMGFALNRVLDELPVPDVDSNRKGMVEYDAWRERVTEKMKHEVLNAICERFTFDTPEGKDE